VPTKALVEDMVGRPLDRMFPAIPTPDAAAAPLIEVLGLTSPEGDFSDVSFSVRPGEVFGVAGIVGAGRTELMRAIAGADPVSSGSVKVNGKVVKLDGPADALAQGVVLVPEDRKAQGLILGQTIGENLALGNYQRVAPSGWITSGRTQAFARRGIARFLIKGSADQPASTLSGGNQQKVVIAKWLATRPKVIVLDEPTKGIDIGSKAAVHDFIGELAGEGLAVVLISSELPEVMALADRLIVMKEGRIVEEFKRGRWSAEAVVGAATGARKEAA
jgi:ribose transport system ATP-binding protein